MNPSPRPAASALTEWEILDLAPGEGSPVALTHGGDAWIPCPAPGDTYLALHRAGRIPHPLADRNEAACSWVRDREWWWRIRFDADAPEPNERVQLCFEGLDTYATIWLDDTLLGSCDNMFTPLRFDIGTALRKASSHVLLVRFAPPAQQVADKSMPIWPFIADPIKASKRNFHRKAQFGWGWDWGPDLPTVGLWQPVHLLRQRIAAIDDLQVVTQATPARAHLQITLSIDEFATRAGDALNVQLRLFSPTGDCAAQARLAIDADQQRVGTELVVEQPELWWTPELGAPALYRLEAALCRGTQTLDSRTQAVGIRRIELDTSPDPDEPGCDFFRFVLNGVPLFARGVNWIPASSFVGAVTVQDYESLLRSAIDANINMLRVWGGGVYEADAFYDACDRLGLLVWQDFMFACAPYPDHDADLVGSVRREVDAQVRRLRHHPCLALWCGNNEGQAVHQLVDRLSGTKTRYPGDLIFETLIPDALRQLDPATPYRPGSPYGGPSHNSMRAGDVHNWTVWHGLPPVPDELPVGGFDHSPAAVAYTRYAEDKARFVSEFGIQAAPARATLERWIGHEALALDSAAFLDRIKDRPKNKVNAMLLPVTGLPGNLDEYVDYTQLVQAEGLKFGVEHYRRRKPHCSGTLIWQYNDCWPGISWSLVDHDGVRKASWFYVARAYAPLMASFKTLDNGDVELWISNDRQAPAQIDATVTMLHLNGEPLWRESLSINAGANQSVAVWRADAATIAASPDRVLTVRSPNFAGNRLLFAAFKDLPLADELPQMQIEALDDGGLAVTLRGTRYHSFVHLQGDDASLRYSDNYFDLQAGEVRSLHVTADQPLRTDALRLRAFHPKTA
ncbi:glycoside hydrolase family 2 protein [Solimonas terrae]|uniref:Beta-mannosidase B n=1 Tax=Solimonas terrae TaxID=1396819 RepID=A0A6M2BV84_9GAMM|nr:glycoside hydrolase family 2 protein [Solimonas terrae]NGY05857.1 glycoside hydrolase family 2 protein [Solimonas terrae]